MTPYTTDYHCAICGGRDMDRMLVSAHDGRIEHADLRDCVRVLASRLAQAQEDIRALEYRLNRAGIGHGG